MATPPTLPEIKPQNLSKQIYNHDRYANAIAKGDVSKIPGLLLQPAERHQLVAIHKLVEIANEQRIAINQLIDAVNSLKTKVDQLEVSTNQKLHEHDQKIDKSLSESKKDLQASAQAFSSNLAEAETVLVKKAAQEVFKSVDAHIKRSDTLAQLIQESITERLLIEQSKAEK